MSNEQIKKLFTDEEGKYYNLWKGEIEGQLSDGMWENEPYQPGEDRFADLMGYVGDRMLFLGAAQRLGMNIKDDPWIKMICWIFYQKGVSVIDYIQSHNCSEVLEDYLKEQKENGVYYWVKEAQCMVDNREKVEKVWDLIANGDYDFEILYNDLEEMNDLYDNH